MRVDVMEQTGDQTAMEINRYAPVVSKGEIAIAASPESVWKVLTAFERWPTWNPEVKSMSLNGPVAPGSTFRWKAGPGRITSQIQLVEPPRRIVWTGHTLGIRAIASWRLEPRDGTTLARVAESFEGMLPRAFRRLLQSTLDRSLADGLRHLRIEAERVAARVR
jgi:uncharacterized protein YndB with AHSA1/START domain